jgi:hypothetical protein
MGATGGRKDGEVVAPATFIVRAWRDASGRLTGVVERVTTGEKARFEGAEGLAQFIQRTLAKPKAPPPPGNVPDG